MPPDANAVAAASARAPQTRICPRGGSAKVIDLSLTQRNLKQKFAALLRRFRVPEELAERGAARDTHHAQRDIDELFQELESLSCGEGEDSGPDQMDTISIGSTPKPSLRPFFSSSRSLANQDHHRHSNGEGEKIITMWKSRV
ncbi:Phosphofurin acidic cluster sorting protein 1 [Eumeta japonica]|uniref:Phosphofurin acidic cluster sorting protein 1 n=1 Tax=Eumeta variegata TaxID=151549 RepID=A0A4C1XYI5_EUMVA|nr:Phosphofurin acidic cluster sorting protein 1 [Eumeta japonica]